jgi:hypothetical protein
VIGIVDYYTRYVSTAIVRSTSWDHLEPVLREIFLRFGLPKSVKSDNGPPFSSAAYKEYLTSKGVTPEFSWPLNPQQNGAAEATMKHVNRAVQNATAEGTSIVTALEDRIQSHNNSTHTETGKVPSEVMFGRRLRMGLPLIRPARVDIDDEEMRQKDWDSKMKKKEDADKRRHAKPSDIEVGDTVVLERANKRKGETLYDPTEWKVKSRRQGDLTLLANDGTEMRRDITKVKKIAPATQPAPIVAGADSNPAPSALPAQPAAQPADDGSLPTPVAVDIGQDRPKRARKKTQRYGNLVLNMISTGPLIIG